MRFKFWVAHARYDQPDASEFAGQAVRRRDPQPQGGEGLHQGLHGRRLRRLRRLVRAALRRHARASIRSSSRNRGGGSFRVEEYKKPEFEVKVEAPTAPVMLGEKVAATIKAKYYFGGPGRRGEGQVQDHPHDGRRALVSRRPLGLALRPGLLVVRRRFLVVSRLVALGHAPADRRVVGTSPSAARGRGRGRGADPARRNAARRDRHRAGQGGAPDQDQRYEITAEVTDQSRRTIVGHGDRAGRPQAVRRLHLGRSRPLPRRRHDRGRASAPRRSTTSRSPARGRSGCSRSPTTPSGKPVETPVESWDIDARRRRPGPPDDQGRRPRASTGSRATIDDGKGHAIEGGYLLTITGQGFDGASFRFNDLEIIPERKEYRPGETLRLLINTNQVNSTVLLFVRPTNGVYLPPRSSTCGARARSRRSASSPATCPTSSSRP